MPTPDSDDAILAEQRAYYRAAAAQYDRPCRAVFVDDGPVIAAYEEGVEGGPVPTVPHRLDDGTRYRIVKVFHDPATLTADLAALGWTAHVRTMGDNIIGTAEHRTPRPEPPPV